MPAKIYQEKQKRDEEVQNLKKKEVDEAIAKQTLINQMPKNQAGFTEAPYIR